MIETLTGIDPTLEHARHVAKNIVDVGVRERFLDITKQSFYTASPLFDCWRSVILVAGLDLRLLTSFTLYPVATPNDFLALAAFEHTIASKPKRITSVPHVGLVVDDRGTIWSKLGTGNPINFLHVSDLQKLYHADHVRYFNLHLT